MLVHAKHRWPKAINAHLLPYALRMANDVHMHAPNKSGKAPLDLFSTVASISAPKHFHPFGCPVFVLSEQMQSNGKGPKWEERARIGINLGNSPLHAQSVALVLNVETGLMSPQFHVKFDDLFETVSSSTSKSCGPNAQVSSSPTRLLQLSHQYLIHSIYHQLHKSPLIPILQQLSYNPRIQ
jgi:hypothetical protein